MRRFRGADPGLVVVALVALARPAGAAGEASRYLREHIYDATVHGDEAAVDVRIAFNRWPDCTTLESAIADIFRLEGVADGSGQEKALALWKWFRILVSATGGSYAYEGPPGAEVLCHDPHKIFTVYGHHQCDGQSWAMVDLWRAAGYMALDECTYGHTTAALRYRDADGVLRYHSFDPQRRYYHWDPWNERVATRSLPVMRGMVYRHLTAPREIHSLRTSLRVGETIDRQWFNSGHIVPSGTDKREAMGSSYYACRPGKADGVYASAGEEIQTLIPARPDGLCAQEKDRLASFTYRLPPPYVVAGARIRAALRKGKAGDLCRLSISRDGKAWDPVYEKESVGEEAVDIPIGWEAWEAGRPNVFTAYGFFVKIELQAAGDVRAVGAKDLAIEVRRTLNKRTLPHLRPGENIVRVTAERIDPAYALEVAIAYRVDGEAFRVVRNVTRIPYAFSIEVPAVPEVVRDNYDQHWNDGPLQMDAITMRLVPRAGAPPALPSLDDESLARAFARSDPHPADMTRREPAERSERDVRETSGFFPQADEVSHDRDALAAAVARFRRAEREEKWIATEDLGRFPEAIDILLEALPGADGDLLIPIAKALSRIRDPRAIEPLLRRWARVPGGAPGTRYIPDALAAIGDRRVVPALIAPLARCRFDFRFHIAHALGILGGPEAEAALRDLGENDPFPAVREEAARALDSMRP
ncbi:MAG: HEAT repeat domain-containing protein [Planctomycetes bacterium]|nr:HEAT repeat domain-containing protein [Planctomycetota bacterium]